MKRVCVVTGTRAEYGLLHPLLKRLAKDPVALQLLVTGAHLSERHGLTYREIEEDGFGIDERVELPLDDDSPLGIARAAAAALGGIADALGRLAPDLVVVLGDRYEIFAAATAAHILGIPIAHIHGGEVTEGAIDDAFRHAVTKMSALHFVATEEYRKRVVQLGEEPDRVFTVGALGLDNIVSAEFVEREELERQIGFPLGGQSALATFHPVTLATDSVRQLEAMLAALDCFPELHLLFTGTNADAEGIAVQQRVQEYVGTRLERAHAIESLGRRNYLSAMRCVDFVIGNSSSGIIETPSFGIPTVDIGRRQKGRVKADSVIECEPREEDIVRAIERALSPEFREQCRNVVNPYGDGRAAERIESIVLDRVGHLSPAKSFHDLHWE